jgi:ABC-type multidrug transport system ATPase subunit
LPLLDDVPPLVELARRVGWQPLPLTVREAKRFVPRDLPPPPSQAKHSPGDELLRCESLTHRYDGHTALQDVTFNAHAGEVIALIGRNGSGKTTLLKQLIGLLRPQRGRVLHIGRDIARQPVHEIARTTGYVPQHPSTILHRETLRDELAFTARAQRRAIDPLPILERLGIAAHIDRHPLDLSGGERQRAALAAIAVAEPAVLLLDEPTRGLPGRDKRVLGNFLRQYADEGRLVIVATHDVEFVAAFADRVLMLAEGELIADDTPAAVLAGSLAFAPQLNRLFGSTVLTIDEAQEILAHSPGQPRTNR